LIVYAADCRKKPSEKSPKATHPGTLPVVTKKAENKAQKMPQTHAIDDFDSSLI
jgi:hypothetical protein